MELPIKMKRGAVNIQVHSLDEYEAHKALGFSPSVLDNEALAALDDRVRVLEEKIASLIEKRGPGRPPRVMAEAN